MKRVIGYGIFVVLVLAGLLWPVIPAVIGPLDSSTVNDPVEITQYRATYDVAANGDMVAVEDITADFPPGRHGIFRFWDVADPSNPNVRYVPTLGEITMDGARVPYETYWESGNRYFVAKIGDPDRTLRMGLHTYRITYSVPGVISPPTVGTGTFVSSEGSDAVPPQSAFFWNVVAQGWQMRMDAADITVRLPSASGQVQCTAGAYRFPAAEGEGPCTIRGAGTSEIRLSAKDIPPRSGMTARAAMAMPAPPQVTVPWPVALDKVFGTSVQKVAGVLTLALAGLILGLAWARGSAERPPGFPVMYAPPQGLGPVQTVYMDTEGVGSHGLVASLLYMADRGLVSLEHRSDDSWLVKGLVPESAWVDVDPVTFEVGRRLGVTNEGYWFLADGSKDAGAKLAGIQTSLLGTTKAWAEGGGFSRKSRAERIGRWVWFAFLILAIVGFIGWLGGLTMYGLPFAAFCIGGLGLMGIGVGTRRTATGRVLWSQSGGFERLLSTPSAEDRFDFAARKDLFISYVPYAVAFDVADKWAAKYRIATGEEPPTPRWYPYGYTGAALYSSGAGFDAFEKSVSSSISAYEASQRSSSSSGGGGSSFGGGGGGGGGGSW